MARTDPEPASSIVGRLGAPAIDLVSMAQALAVAEHKSFSAAAMALGLRQSGISQRIRKLEDLIGVALFERRPRGVNLTLAGEEFITRARSILAQVDCVVAGAQQAGRGEAGHLRIGIFTSIAGGFLRELILAFREGHPRVEIELRECDRRRQIAAVRDHSLDIGFATGSGKVIGCDTVELWKERVHVALAAEHPLANREALDWLDLRDEHFIVSAVPPGPEVHDYIVRRLADYSHYPTVERLAVGQEPLMNLVGMGFGVTMVSAGWTAVGLPGLVLRPMMDAEDLAPFSAIWSPENDNPVMRRFLSLAHVMARRSRRGASDWAVVRSADPPPSAA